jgi:prophage antirepressor-like protein
MDAKYKKHFGELKDFTDKKLNVDSRTIFINESGVHDLIFGKKNDKNKEFGLWLIGNVSRSIGIKYQINDSEKTLAKANSLMTDAINLRNTANSINIFNKASAIINDLIKSKNNVTNTINVHIEALDEYRTYTIENV